MQRWIILVDDLCIKLRRAARAKELSQKEARAGLPARPGCRAGNLTGWHLRFPACVCQAYISSTVGTLDIGGLSGACHLEIGTQPAATWRERGTATHIDC